MIEIQNKNIMENILLTLFDSSLVKSCIYNDVANGLLPEEGV